MAAYWNNRIVKHGQDGGIWYGLHEVFYDDNDEPEAYTLEPIAIVGDSVKDVEGQLAMIMKDLKSHPPLDSNQISTKANSMHPDAKMIWEQIGESFYTNTSSGWSIANLAKHKKK